MKKIYFTLILIAAVVTTNAQIALIKGDFENFSLQPNSVLNGVGNNTINGSFNSGNVEFRNQFSTGFGGYWSSGWAYSNMQNDSVEGTIYASYAKSGYNSSNYAVGKDGSVLELTGVDAGNPVQGMYVTNNTYAGLSMKNGDMFGKKFGGDSGDDPDFFVLTIKAYSGGALKADSVNFYLADFRFSDHTQDYIVKDWTWVNLSALGNADSLLFILNSSDVGQFGMNTPAYFCIDDVITDSDTADMENLFLYPNSNWDRGDAALNTLYEDSVAFYPSTYNVSSLGDFWSAGFAISNKKDTTTAGHNNMYSVISGQGNGNSSNYAIGQNGSTIHLKNTIPGSIVHGIYVNNTTYAALSMRTGDSFAKKFGGVSGNDSDFFVLTIKGYKNGAITSDSVNFYLADFRFADNNNDYIVKDWTFVRLSDLGVVDSLLFSLSSSDVGPFGMNTPAFFAIDDVTIYLSSAAVTASAKNHELKIYPNPASSFVNVEAHHQVVAVSVYDLSGKEMIHTTESSVDLSALNTGMYIIRVETEACVISRRLIKN